MTRIEDQDTGNISGGITAWNENRSWKWGTAVKLSHVVDSFLGGSHDIKTGYQHGVTGGDNLNGPNDVLTTYSVTGRQATGITQLPYHQGAEAFWDGTYIDDTYRLSRAVVNVGVRYDHSRATFPSFPLPRCPGAADGAVSRPERRRLFLEHVLSPRRPELPGDLVGQHGAEGALRALLQSPRAD